MESANLKTWVASLFEADVCDFLVSFWQDGFNFYDQWLHFFCWIFPIHPTGLTQKYFFSMITANQLISNENKLCVPVST